MPDNIRSVLYEYIKNNTVCESYTRYKLFVHAKKMLSFANKDTMREYYDTHIKNKQLSYTD